MYHHDSFSMADTQEITLTKQKTKSSTPWQVIVFDDPVNLMPYVTRVFQRVFSYPKEKAEYHMTEVHQLGKSLLWTGDRERAEVYVQQLHTYQLKASLQKSE